MGEHTSRRLQIAALVTVGALATGYVLWQSIAGTTTAIREGKQEGLQLAQAAQTSPDAVAVECRPVGAVLKDGFTCAIEHRQGVTPVYACWDINLGCLNGAAGKAHGCGDVEPQARSTVLVPFSAFGGKLDLCDQVSSTSVNGIVLSAR